MPLQVSRDASARAIWPWSSSLSRSAISAQGRLSTAAVFGPTSLAKSLMPTVKRVAASICQTKRIWRGRVSVAARPGVLEAAIAAAASFARVPA